MRFNVLPKVSGKAGRTLAASGAFLATALASSSVCAASDTAIDGAGLSLFWVLPFAGILGSLAILPTLAPHFWHRNYGLVALFWGLAFLAPFAAVFGAGAAFHEFVHVLVLEYIPFIALIGALFVIAGGIHIGGDLRGTPAMNSAVMLAGTILASFAGTTSRRCARRTAALSVNGAGISATASPASRSKPSRRIAPTPKAKTIPGKASSSSPPPASKAC